MGKGRGNPQAFLDYLRPVLEEMVSGSAKAGPRAGA